MQAIVRSTVAGGLCAREIRVVHSGRGRLRVHLKHWSGARREEIADSICRLHGVNHAEASPITANALILFDPRQTTEQTLLAGLPSVLAELPLDSLPKVPVQGADAPAVLPVAVHDGPTAPVVYMTGAGRVVYKALGWSSVGMAVVGAITPGIPTAPFVVLAGYFFIRSSPEAHQWLRESRWFGPILRDWEQHRAVRRSLRNAGLGLIVAGMGITVMLGLPALLTTSILSMQLIGVAIILSLPVIPAEAPAPNAIGS
jgi:uncharacterized membrane protein YbaN (DUF454 family)